MIDRVRKSSGVIIGFVMLEIDLAANLNARNDAVRFDLKADFLRGNISSTPWMSLFSLAGISKTLKSSSSMSSSELDRGCSKTSSLGGEAIDCILRDGVPLLLRGLGVVIDESEMASSPMELSSRDGTDSLDIVLDDR